MKPGNKRKWGQQREWETSAVVDDSFRIFFRFLLFVFFSSTAMVRIVAGHRSVGVSVRIMIELMSLLLRDILRDWPERFHLGRTERTWVAFPIFDFLPFFFLAKPKTRGTKQFELEKEKKNPKKKRHPAEPNRNFPFRFTSFSLYSFFFSSFFLPFFFCCAPIFGSENKTTKKSDEKKVK